ncbi:Uncharacterised protein [Pannonibacter phragmitetus]|uniref:Uncharacterized protein n=1 Tax=Pannonibacter phragmitetus TaxID=121719 RepID=A0A378ZS48_9HYPH|nr:Uncharacterised protein [Pannonibacter phragmitetus]
MADPELASSARRRGATLAVALLALSGLLHGQVAEAKSAAPQGGLAAGQVAGQGAPAKTVPSGKPAAKAKAQSQSQVKTKPKPAPAVPASKIAGRSQADSPAKVPVSRPATAPVPVADQQADQQANPAQESAPSEAPVADPQRYALVKVDGNYLRLDRVAGTIAFCKPVNGVWRCMPSPDAEAAYLGEIDQLRQENAALRQEIAVLKGETDSTTLGRPSAEAPRGNTRPAPELSQKDEEQLDEMLSFTEQAMRRFFGLMRDLQKETGQ